MIRDLDQLTDRTFDVLVVGGGIYGLTIAYDAAQRGLSVALIEQNDFGSGASFNHLRTIHGGLRYLQSLDFKRARESVRERRTLARVAPQAVRPLPFAVPVYRSLTRGKMAMRTGFALDRILAAGRNRGVPASHRLPGGRVVSRSHAAQRFPGLRSGALRHGGIGPRLRSRRDGDRRARRRRIHRGPESGVPSPGSDARRRHARAPRRGAGGGPGESRGARGARADSRSRGAGH